MRVSVVRQDRPIGRLSPLVCFGVPISKCQARALRMHCAWGREPRSIVSVRNSKRGETNAGWLRVYKNKRGRGMQHVRKGVEMEFHALRAAARWRDVIIHGNTAQLWHALAAGPFEHRSLRRTFIDPHIRQIPCESGAFRV